MPSTINCTVVSVPSAKETINVFVLDSCRGNQVTNWPTFKNIVGPLDIGWLPVRSYGLVNWVHCATNQIQNKCTKFTHIINIFRIQLTDWLAACVWVWVSELVNGWWTITNRLVLRADAFRISLCIIDEAPLHTGQIKEREKSKQW